jgi:N-acetylglucosaminyldiphosphoundecaprenol N-acetyl-beta-D-mannosaminyltransferase
MRFDTFPQRAFFVALHTSSSRNITLAFAAAPRHARDLLIERACPAVSAADSHVFRSTLRERLTMNRIRLGEIEIDPVTMDETVHRIMTQLSEARARSIHVATLNAQFVQLARDDRRFCNILRKADLGVADGVPLVWACRLLGRPIPGRVNGTDLMVRLCGAAALYGRTVYFLGGRPDAAERAAQQLIRQYPGLRIAGIDCPPMGFVDNDELDAAVSSRIEKARPDFLFVGLGAPKQEYWIHNHRHLSAGVMMGVGGSFELVGGVTKRAPLIFQRAGLEWFWRLMMEPSRLWKRYLVGNTLFVFVVLQQWLTGWRAHKDPKQSLAE